MTTTADTTATAAAPTRSPAADWTRGGRLAAAAAFVGGGALWTVGDLIGWGRHGVDQLTYARDHATASGVAMAVELLGTVFMFGTAVAWFLLSRRRSPKLAVAGGVLLTLGLTAQGAMSGLEIAMYALVRQGGIPLARIETSLNSASAMGLPGTVFAAMFFVGAFAGLVVMMVALWRSRAVSRAAIILVLLFQVGQAVDIVPTSPLMFLGLAWMAIDVLRAGSATTAPVSA